MRRLCLLCMLLAIIYLLALPVSAEKLREFEVSFSPLESEFKWVENAINSDIYRDLTPLILPNLGAYDFRKLLPATSLLKKLRFFFKSELAVKLVFKPETAGQEGRILEVNLNFSKPKEGVLVGFKEKHSGKEVNTNRAFINFKKKKLVRTFIDGENFGLAVFLAEPITSENRGFIGIGICPVTVNAKYKIYRILGADYRLYGAVFQPSAQGEIVFPTEAISPYMNLLLLTTPTVIRSEPWYDEIQSINPAVSIRYVPADSGERIAPYFSGKPLIGGFSLVGVVYTASKDGVELGHSRVIQIKEIHDLKNIPMLYHGQIANLSSKRCYIVINKWAQSSKYRREIKVIKSK